MRWRSRVAVRPPGRTCDISGSMERYARMLLHFLHAITMIASRAYVPVRNAAYECHRYLRYRDIDLALDKIAEAVVDWSGGTRIGQCLYEFNRDWSCRVLSQGAVVLLITDGLDREGADGLPKEIDRLH